MQATTRRRWAAVAALTLARAASTTARAQALGPQRQQDLAQLIEKRHAARDAARAARAARAASERADALAWAKYLEKMRPIWAAEARAEADLQLRAQAANAASVSAAAQSWQAASHARIATAAEREVSLEQQMLWQQQYGYRPR